MSRKEEILQEAKRKEKEIGFSPLVKNANGINSAYGIGFIEGVEWADLNPDEQMIAKYLYDKKGYPVDLNGNVPSFEDTMKMSEELLNYRKNQFINDIIKKIEDKLDFYSDRPNEFYGVIEKIVKKLKEEYV